MNKDIEEFIKKEKDTSRFKLNILKNRLAKDSVSNDLIENENRFLKYDFENVKFENIDECRSAIDLFRSSFELFEQKYADKRYKIDYDDIISDLFNQIKSVTVEDNLVGGFFIQNISNRNLYNKDGSVRSFVYKTTLKQKILLNCLIKCFKNLMSYGCEYNYEDLNFFFSTIEKNIYKYYNDSYKILKEASMLNDEELSKFKPLEDAIIFFEKIVTIKNKSFLKLDLQHSGYEKINPLYLSIKNDNETELNNFHKFKVILEKNVYYKAVEIGSTNVNIENSSIMIASTRREMEDFNNLKSWLRLKIKNIKNKIVL